MDFPRWMYRKGDGATAHFESQEQFDGMKDQHLWQDTPWRPSKVKFCAECEKLRELVKNLEAEIAGLNEEAAEKDRTIKSFRNNWKNEKAPVR